MIMPKRCDYVKKIIVVVMSMILMTGCSNLSNSANSNSNKNGSIKVTDNTKQNSNTEQPKTLYQTPTTVSTKSSNNNVSKISDSSKKLLSNIMKSAKAGKVINCEFSDKINVDESIKKKWGEPDKTDWVPAAKGTYLSYSKHNVAFGINKGAQIFEVRSFDSNLKKISLSEVKKTFGTPAYDVKSKGEEIIGYVATKDFKILMVFPLYTSNKKDPLMDHYSVLYPQGTVNSMANDPGRKW